MKRTVIFDLGGVYFSDGTRRAIDKIAAGYGIERQTVAEFLNGEAGASYRTGQITVDQFWQQAAALWNIQALPEALSTTWCESYEPNPGTVRLVRQLQAADHQLLYLSDNTQERVAYLEEKYGFLYNFDDGVFSHLARLKKPDPRIYELVLAKALNPAAACVYIDDKSEYLKPAKQLGMKVIAFKNAGQLETELVKLALLPDGGTEKAPI
jgi:HAD superfamily hydrolase (TIGR01509 family)